MRIAKSVAELIGRTPMLELTHFEQTHCLNAHLLAKVESFNPGGSVKDRIALGMVEAAEKAGKLLPGGTLFINSSIISDKVQRSDLRAIYVPCLEIAQELGNLKVANMVMLGAYMEAMKNVGTDTIKEMLVHMFTGPKAKLVDLNIEALKRGAACVG